MTELHNKDEFLNALTNSGIQVMMFTAFWCPDCMYIKPFLPEIEEQFSNLQFYSLNRDHCMDIAIEYEVMGIPSFICFKDGRNIKICFYTSQDKRRNRSISESDNRK